ncbi:MAG TPA: chemotaxis protein CheA [Thermomicrobiales bacterium]|nr:chemotaxis protein CheA [Thermomicrobiales bacterium]
MPPTFDASPDELGFFLEEAREILQILDDGLLELEREGAREELLQEIFRCAHTLKGSSATIGHTRMAELTHHLEGVFDRLRQGEIGVTSELVDVAFEALDALRLLSEEVASGEESPVNLEPILARLAGIEGGEGEASTGHEESIYQVRVEFEPGHPLTAARALQLSLELAAAGRVISMTPDRDAIEREEVDGWLEAVVQWPAGGAQLREFLEAAPDVAAVSVTEPGAPARPDAPARFDLTIELDPDNPLRAARAIQVLLALESGGQVLRSAPAMAEIEQQKIGDRLNVLLEWEGDRAGLEAFVQSIPDVTGYRIAEPAAEDPEGKSTERDEPAIPQATPTERARAQNGATTIRMSVERIDRMLNYVGELVIERSRIAETARKLQAYHGDGPEIERLLESTAQIEFLISQIHEELMLGRMLPIESVLGKFPRLVRDLARSLGKEVEFTMDCGDVELDRSVIEAISDPLIHIVRNAVDHGIEAPEARAAAGKPEAGRVAITARQVENRIVVTVSDDGKGIDPDALRALAVERGMLSEDAAGRLTDSEAINLIFHSGFSTASLVTNVSGRGVGMDIVRSNLEKVGGSIEVSSRAGHGSVFTIRLPLTLAIIRALLVRCDQWSFALPLDSVVETVRLSDMQVHAVGPRRMMRLRDQIVPLIHLSASLMRGARACDEGHSSGFAVVLNAGSHPLAVLVDDLIGEQEIVVKPLGAYIPPVPGLTGATILGDGSFSLIVDVGRLASMEGAEHGPARAA